MPMTEQVSMQTKLKRLEGLIDTKDITDWENQFLKSVVPVALARAKIGQVMGFTDKQQQVMDDLFSKHFAG